MLSDPDSAPTSLTPDERLVKTEQALQALRTQQEVLAAGISHDLRAPLRAISSYAGLIDQHHSAALGEEGRGYVQRIREAAARMDGLIDGLLQLSHVARASLRMQRVDVGMLVEWSLAELQDAEPGRVLEATVQPDLFVRGDERQLKQLFERLLHNAWKFSSQQETVRIRVSGKIVDGRMQIEVGDEGRGFDMRYAGRLFEPFQRLHPTEQGGGDGLGLAIAHAIVERHGSRLWADSEPGRGSVFQVQLPLDIDAESAD
ncbi:sensor histidine kinase [Luteimonas sp. A478]